MARRDSTLAPLARYTGAIPGHMRELRSIAEAAGIVVRFGLLRAVCFGIAEDDEDEPPRLCARLTGSPVAFERAGLAPQGFQCVRYRRTHGGQFPLYFVCTGDNELCADFVDGDLQSIEKRGRVEIATYQTDDERCTKRAYWGCPEAVAKALQLSVDRLTSNKRNTARGGLDRLLWGWRWQARVYPSGNVRVLWRDDSPEIAQRRQLTEDAMDRLRQRVASARADGAFQAFMLRLTDPRYGANPS